MATDSILGSGGAAGRIHLAFQSAAERRPSSKCGGGWDPVGVFGVFIPEADAPFDLLAGDEGVAGVGNEGGLVGGYPAGVPGSLFGGCLDLKIEGGLFLGVIGEFPGEGGGAAVEAEGVGEVFIDTERVWCGGEGAGGEEERCGEDDSNDAIFRNADDGIGLHEESLLGGVDGVLTFFTLERWRC